MFKVKKTVIIYFACKSYKPDSEPFIIKEKAVQSKEQVKILEIMMNVKLRYKKHIVRAIFKKLEAVMKLRWLRGLFSLTAQQLFTATVASVIDYVFNV